MKKNMLALLVLSIFLITALFAAGAQEKTPAAPEKVTIEWWDHFLPLAELHKRLFAESESETGVPIVYSQYDPAKQSEALLLAFRTNSTPDVFSKTMPVSEIAMYKEGWFSPMAIDKNGSSAVYQECTFEGYTLFDGKVYSSVDEHQP